jgi:hypothetical protein
LIRAPEFSLLPDGQPFLQAHSYVRIGTRCDEFVCGIVINRTNNPLERFNKKFGDSFNVNHASLEDFIQTVKSISEEYVKDRDRILRHQMNPPERRLEHAYFPIPADYSTWEAPVNARRISYS